MLNPIGCAIQSVAILQAKRGISRASTDTGGCRVPHFLPLLREGGFLPVLSAVEETLPPPQQSTISVTPIIILVMTET